MKRQAVAFAMFFGFAVITEWYETNMEINGRLHRCARRTVGDMEEFKCVPRFLIDTAIKVPKMKERKKRK